MKMNFFKIVTASILLFFLTTIGFAAKPNTIPALQEWTDGIGSFTFPASGRIVLDQAYASQLATTGQVFQDDLLSLTGMSHPVVNGTQASLIPGDIFLTISSTDTGLGGEGYTLAITDRIIVNAQQETGTFYGTRTILQLLKQSNIIQAGSARDFPRYPLRALHVDSGRKFVTVGWLKNHIKELAYFKMNLFHWHLAEWNNFRLESSSHPEVVAAQYYTKAQFADMMALAKKYHITVMPEFEMPGHMGWALAKNPSLRVVDNTGYVNPDNIDLTKDASYALISDLLREWLPLIPGPYFHIGTDEYITDYSKFPQYLTYAQSKWGPTANAKDVYFYFINWANDLVRSYGKTTWAWDDSKTGGSVFSINKNMILDSWTYAAQSELNQGFSLINCAQAVLYYVWYTDWEPMQTQLYETWAPHQWSYTNSGPLQPYQKGLLGAKLALWFDKNQTEEYSMAWGMKNSMRTVAQQTWASPKIYSRYTDFKTLSDQLGRAPGTTFPNTQPPIVKPNGPYSSAFGSPITFSSAGTTARNGSIASYKWDFGDGGTSTLANPTYTYRATGAFKALLVATDTNGMNAGNEAQVNVGTSNPITVTVSPTFVTLPPGGTQQFSAVVTGTSNTAVTWATTGGTISSNGFYTAPMFSGDYSVVATTVVQPPVKSQPSTVRIVSNPPPGGNLALNKPATASTSFSSAYAPSMAVDADPNNTRWCAVNGTNGQWLRVDLGATYNLTGTKIKWESNGVWRYKVEVSTNGSTWTLAVDRTANNAPAQTYDDTFTASGRYVRVTATTNQPGHWASIFDFQVMGS